MSSSVSHLESLVANGPKWTTSDRDNVYVRAAFNYVDAINEAVALPEHDPTRLRDCMSKDSVVELLPSTMRAPTREHSFATADDQIGYLAGMRSLVKESSVEIYDYVYAPGPRVILQAKAKGQSPTGQPYTNDYVFFINFVDLASPSATEEDRTDLAKQGNKPERAGLPKAVFTREYVDSAFVHSYVKSEEERKDERNKR